MSHEKSDANSAMGMGPGSGSDREELHHRRIDMRGYRRRDGLYEVEGRVTDRKPEEFVPLNGSRRFAAGTPIHDMGVRIVFDESMVVHEIHTFTEAAPYDECPQGGRALQVLKGLRLGGGWGKEVRSRLGGEKSCTHLMELLLPLATVAYQSMSMVNRARPLALDPTGRPMKIDSCYAYGAQRSLVRELWPQYYRPADPAE